MFTRIFSPALLVLLAACGKTAGTADEKVTQAAPSDRVECAVAKNQLTADCAIERQGNAITVRHADGSFRRFEIDAQGKFGAADGAEEVSGQKNSDGSVDVTIGDRHYRFGPGQLQP